ncbi:hypothetical protein BH23THE1_BH23THE1_07900 [soil metagenome]
MITFASMLSRLNKFIYCYHASNYMKIRNRYRGIFGHKTIERYSCNTVGVDPIQMILNIKITPMTSLLGNYN